MFRIGANYQQLPVNQSVCPYRMGNFQRDGQMAFFNQGARPNYLSSIDPIQFRDRSVNLNKVHGGDFLSNACTFLSTIYPEDFNAPRKLWEKVFDDAAKDRFIETVSTHMSTCREKEIIKRQIAIFREVSDDIATRLEKATGIKGYEGISGLLFNGSHNGMYNGGVAPANKMKDADSLVFSNGVPGDKTQPGDVPVAKL
jgi:catalase